ncbi:lantibiotic dehydratase C-terminal domain-containing protein [Nonomuraea angiospora]|uniref:lantibiotic dehydratase C-terminal domain-containing protein n=1 Tax=Nonomuraea angiospora TaxID=46172 RepID=UPI0033EC9974
MSWVSVHVFSQGPLDDMISGLAGPLLGDDGFFLRYWEGGPHLRIRVRSHPAEHVVERAEAYLREHPSEAVIDPEEYARLAATLAARDLVPGYTQRLYPNDSAHLIPYRPEHGRYGTGRSLDALERHFHDSSVIALQLIEAGLGNERRGAAWLTMLLVAWQVAGEGRMFGPPGGLLGPPGDAGFPVARERLVALVEHARTVTQEPPLSELRGVDGGDRGSGRASAGQQAGDPVQREARLRHLASRAARESEVEVG